MASYLSMFCGKQGYDSIDCDHMEIDLVISQIQGLKHGCMYVINLAAV